MEERQIFSEINRRLGDLESELIYSLQDNDNNLVVISGAPRSGSTLLSQILAFTGNFNYITNFIAKFWEAPYVGFLIEKEFHLREINFNKDFKSEYGATNNINDPHEFGYFWNKYIPYSKKSHVLSHNVLNAHEFSELKKELIALKSASTRPLLLKNLIFGINLRLVRNLFPHNVQIIVIKRDPIYNAQSIYNTRLNFSNCEDYFWSLKPSRSEEIENLPYYKQIPLQIKFIYEDIYSQLNETKLDYIEVEYEELVTETPKTLNKILGFCGINKKVNNISSLSNIKNSNNQKVSDDVFNKLKLGVSKYF
jgi:hypothetical protein